MEWYCINELKKTHNSPEPGKNLPFIIFLPSSICLCVFTTSKGNVTTPAICKFMENTKKITIGELMKHFDNQS